MNLYSRGQLVRAMDSIARCVNDEDMLDFWLTNGVADGDLDCAASLGESLEYYSRDENFARLMETFLSLMEKTKHSGGLYHDGVVSNLGKVKTKLKERNK